ncbi:hypothetical protein [Magnetospirillum sp. SS-4]|uniref:hypothetical protein n=1 Tax=Magnetospirillum sp. SS-4 TaxID=2681465 RepID=UPI001381565D|nr:hypothetical protein [Magnetospirillum sp. SS-4]CAA7612192.1 conserved membrane hypothetical protein [Magnetospirillum sp. SS-4]
MRPSLKFLHILGIALFLGSLPGHIVLGGVLPGGDIPALGIMFSRRIVLILTLAATIPGLVLAVGSGLMLRSRLSPPRPSWLGWHMRAGLTVLAVGLLVITPQVFALAGMAAELAEDRFDPAAWGRAKLIEDVAGTVNLLLALATMALACFKPDWRRGKGVGE